MNDPDRLTRAATNASPLIGGMLLQFVAAGASVGIAIALYPVLKQWGAGMALGSVVFRTLEAAMYSVGAVGLLSLLPLARQVASGDATERAGLAAVGELLVGIREAAAVAGVLAFIVGALLYSWLLYRSNLVPRWLSGWGIAALLVMIAACMLALFEQKPVTSYVVLVIPIGVQEVVLALWLIAKGFNSAALESVQPRARGAIRPDHASALIQVQGGHP